MEGAGPGPPRCQQWVRWLASCWGGAVRSRSSHPILPVTLFHLNSTHSWVAEDWEHCTKTCGSSGFQLRTVRCLQPLHNGTNRSVNSKYCVGERPESRRPCNRVPCPAQWKTGPWNEVGVGYHVPVCVAYVSLASVSHGLCVNCKVLHFIIMGGAREINPCNSISG